MDQVHEYENLVADVLNEGFKTKKKSYKTLVIRNHLSELTEKLKNLNNYATVVENQDTRRISAQRKHQQKTNLKPPLQAHLAENEEVIVVVVVEANLVENKADWILDTRASKHCFSNKELFQKFHKASDGECVFMGNSATTGVLGKGKIFLKLTSDKTLALNDIPYVPSLRINLISSSVLNKVGLK
ncbi:UNVERIFIED_CONTAM: hypothetical protein Sangu_3158400 [Sesamum angustifolium]|uniref:Retrovirus-related Pol polyprotein from transposon TNT 1-94-like beta-barrel domain-containing protein n=1 Tax=Sesamum angustifolium TaxID=2727405 RepID=A0AAW2JU29_9LAMI